MAVTTDSGRSPSGRAGRASTEPQSAVRLGHSATIPNAGYPAGALSRCEEFIAAVLDNGRTKKTTVYFVSCGFNGHRIAPVRESREFIWPLKFSAPLGGESLFVDDVRGDSISLRDRHIIPNDYNANFAFLSSADAEVYASAGEAGTAETTKIGSAEGEHATAEGGDAQPEQSA